MHLPIRLPTVRRLATAAILTAALATVGLITTEPADARNPVLRGWVLIGEDHPVTGARVSFANLETGKRIPGLGGWTGLDGEFIVDTRGVRLPRQVVAIVSGGYVGRERNGKGRLRARVPMRGPGRGIVYVTPLSTLALALAREHPDWTLRDAEERARELMGLPEEQPSTFAPWADGGAQTQHDDREIDPDRLDADIDREGGFSAWVADMLEHDDRDAPVDYAPNAIRDRAVDPTGILITFTFNRALSAAQSCKETNELFDPLNPASVLAPPTDSGRIAWMLRETNTIDKDPACMLPALDKRLDDLGWSLERSASRLQVLGQQMTRMEESAQRLDQQLQSLRSTLREDAYAGAVADLSATEAAILTVQLNRQTLVQRMESYRAPRSPRNPIGLGMPLADIFASTDPAHVRIAESLRQYSAQNATGPRIANWSTAQATLTQPGVLVPGNGAKGLLRLASDYLDQPGIPVAERRERMRALVRYYQELYRLLMIQQVDVWRVAGLPDTVIQRQAERRRGFDERLSQFAP